MGTSKTQYTHVAFADESNWNQGRYRSISLVTAGVDDARIFHRELDTLRKSHNKDEYKWSNPNEIHGISLANFFFEHHERIRIDVLIWDMEDSRHLGVRRRDDKADFARMYYHLLHNVLKMRWPNGSRWLICPDQQKEVDWHTLGQCLDGKGWANENNLFTVGINSLRFLELYNIKEFRCVCSKDMLLVQLADMFAGLAAYSYTAFEKYQQWKFAQNPTSFLFPMEQIDLSNNDKHRLPVLHHIRQESGKYKFKVSLDSSKGLCTKDPTSPLNFWLYEPQRASDKAPTK